MDKEHTGSYSRKDHSPEGGTKGTNTNSQNPCQATQQQQEVRIHLGCFLSNIWASFPCVYITAAGLDIGMASTGVLHLFVCVCLCREIGEDADSQGDGSSQPDTISIASRTSQNTADSDKVETQHVSFSLQSTVCTSWETASLSSCKQAKFQAS